PRMVLEVDKFKVSRSLGKQLRQIHRQQDLAQARIRVTCDLAFEQVIGQCAALRSITGTWSSPDIQKVYTERRHAGCAHRIESWVQRWLARSLYGVTLGRFFFGGTMCALQPAASEIALARLVEVLRSAGVPYIGCQPETSHLASLGAAPIPP